MIAGSLRLLVEFSTSWQSCRCLVVVVEVLTISALEIVPLWWFGLVAVGNRLPRNAHYVEDFFDVGRNLIGVWIV